MLVKAPRDIFRATAHAHLLPHCMPGSKVRAATVVHNAYWDAQQSIDSVWGPLSLTFDRPPRRMLTRAPPAHR